MSEERDQQIEMIIKTSNEISKDIYKSFSKAMHNENLTGNNRVSCCLLSICSILHVLGHLLKQADSKNASFDDMLNHLKTVDEFFKIKDCLPPEMQ